MLYFYLIPSFIAGLITFSLYSYCGSQFLQALPNEGFTKESFPARSRHNIPIYMWDIYAEGITNGKNSSSADIVKGITPKFLGPFFRSRFYPNHGKQEIEFIIPKSSDGETLVDAEIRLTTNSVRKFNLSFQLFQKDFKWVFLDANTVPSSGGLDWISLKATQSLKALQQASDRISFLVVSIFNNFREENNRFKLMNYLQPVLLLSYMSPKNNELIKMDNISNLDFRKSKVKRKIRKKRNALEEYEEETNRIWEDASAANNRPRARNTCRRKPLYIEFSEIDYDTWIVAPSGYEAFQCVGKCTFPVSEHLSPTKHAIVQTLMHHVSPAKAVRACCVPIRLDPISVLYIDNKGILTYRFHYQDMVVAECGCR